jgi:chromosome segregation and condensation protein ScpB
MATRQTKLKRACRKDERKSQIEREVAAAMVMSQKPLSMTQIAKRLDMRPSSHLMNLLMELATEGRLDYRVEAYRSKGFAAERFAFFIPAARLATAVAAVYEKPGV